MVCIYCGNKTKTINSRPQKKSNSTWRRVQCTKCNATFTTLESCDLSSALRVAKKNGQIEPFSRDKLYLSVYYSVNHLDNAKICASELSNTIINKILDELEDPAISTVSISSVVGQVLKRFNSAAAIKYLSFQKNMQLPKDIKLSLKT